MLRTSRCASSRTSSPSSATPGWCTAGGGPTGGYWLGREADRITIAEIIRAVDGPLATVRGEPADELDYTDDARLLQQVWLALRVNIREILESVSLADLDSASAPPSRYAASPAVRRRQTRCRARPARAARPQCWLVHR